MEVPPSIEFLKSSYEHWKRVTASELSKLSKSKKAKVTMQFSKKKKHFNKPLVCWKEDGDFCTKEQNVGRKTYDISSSRAAAQAARSYLGGNHSNGKYRQILSESDENLQLIMYEPLKWIPSKPAVSRVSVSCLSRHYTASCGAPDHKHRQTDR